MEYLIQFLVNAPDVYYDKPVEFDFDGLKITLHLYDLNMISSSKKLHVIIAAENKEEAYNNAWRKLGNFNNRLIFLTGERISVSHMEFIIEQQANSEIRDILFRDIQLPGIDELSIPRIQHCIEFFNLDMSDSDSASIRYYNEAIRSDSPNEQFRALFLSLEALVGSENAAVICDKCGEILRCPECKGTKEYPRVTKNRIAAFLREANFDDILPSNYLSADNLVKLRATLSHAHTAKSFKSLNKLLSPHRNLLDINHHLSLLIRWHLEKKHNIQWPGGSVIKYGSVATIDGKYRTKQFEQKFALDIPALDELKNHTPGTRWIIN